ncbi:hypothetical protein D3C80_1453250 [compost metagenome]
MSLRETFEITDELPPGRYRLKGRILDVNVDIGFVLRADLVTTLRLTDSMSFTQRFAVDTSAEPPTLYVLREQHHVSHFWIGHCDSDLRLAALLSEVYYWALTDEEREQAYLSEFGQTQNDRWYDHDFLEAGWETKGSNLLERFEEYSWAEEWAEELERRARGMGLKDPNCFIMLGGRPDQPMDWELDDPGHIDRPGINLLYAGKIEFTFF